MIRTALFAAALTAAAPLAASVAVAQNAAPQNAAGAMRAMSASDFAAKVAMSDMYEIESSKIAADKATGAAKDFAQEMIKDHQKTSGELKSLVKENNISVQMPTKLDAKHQQMVDKLKGMSGDGLAKQYMSDQVMAHKEAVAMFSAYSKNGDNQALKGWAGKTLPTLQNHLDMAQKMQMK